MAILARSSIEIFAFTMAHGFKPIVARFKLVNSTFDSYLHL